MEKITRIVRKAMDDGLCDYNEAVAIIMAVKCYTPTEEQTELFGTLTIDAFFRLKGEQDKQDKK